MSDDHTLHRFDVELAAVAAHVGEMGALVCSQLERAARALVELDGDAAEQVIADEAKVNAMERAFDAELGSVIARRQPAARDLRLLLAASRSIANLERAGDQTARIARTAITMISAGLTSRLRLPLGDLRHVCELALAAMRDALDAFARHDPVKAAEVIAHDPRIDAEFDGLMRKLVTFMMEDPRTISASIDLVFVAKAIERIGDHAKNVAEQVIYVERGADVRHASVEAAGSIARGD